MIFSVIIAIVYLSLFIGIRYIKVFIENAKLKGNTDCTIEELSLFYSFDIKNYREEIILIIIGLVSYAFSKTYNELFLVNSILLLTFLYFALLINQQMFFKRLIEQPYFDDMDLFDNDDGVFNKKVEDTLRKAKLLGKGNNLTKKVVILDFLKNKISNSKIRNIILTIYFYSVSVSQVLLIVFASVYWYKKVKGIL